MNDRRTFLAGLATMGVGAAAAPSLAGSTRESPATPAEDRAYWVSVVKRLADPVLGALARGRLKAEMPVEISPGGTLDGRRDVTHLEAVGRLLCGIAPWLELGADGTPEGDLRVFYGNLARRGLAHAVNPRSPDFMNFTRGGQPLVDAAFLAHAVLRAPRELWEKLDEATRRNLVEALRSTRVILPGFNNWLLFSAMVEAGLKIMGAADWDRLRVDYAIRQHEQWYKGDGVYGDGAPFHWDYYNSFVIQPMLLDVLRVTSEVSQWRSIAAEVPKRARRYAAIQERLISPEGTFPPVGRSLAYRYGALQLLGQMALRRELPDGVAPAQVRAAMTTVIRRMTEAPGTFDGNGWLTIGFCGHQPEVGETYISTGSVYLCAAGLLPLGLSAADEFWTAPAQDWTQRRAWSGGRLPADKAL